MKSFIFTTMLITLFFVSPAIACEDEFCKSLQTSAGINLDINQFYSQSSQKHSHQIDNNSLVSQTVEASGSAGNGSKAFFDAQAAQGHDYTDDYSLSGKDVSLSGFSFMETLVSGETSKYCNINFGSYATQYSNAVVDVFGQTGIATSLDMSTTASVTGLGKDLSFSGIYEQGNIINVQGPNGFVFSKGLTGVEINK